MIAIIDQLPSWSYVHNVLGITYVGTYYLHLVPTRTYTNYDSVVERIENGTRIHCTVV